MTKLDDLKNLRDRLQAATGPDRELDFAVLESLGWGPRGPGGRFLYCPYDDCRAIKRPDGSWIEEARSPQLTASLDASLALVDQVLPGVGYGIHVGWKNSSSSQTACHLFYCSLPDNCYAPTAPLAVLIALLKALIAKEAAEVPHD
ncbi:MAG: hypothetical protein F8N37_12220 [Telmatospirillum sp.]|nr:hypothetical protein [Telmatospirillum sp.]